MMMITICLYFFLFFFKQKTAYEMRISDWSSDVCSSDLLTDLNGQHGLLKELGIGQAGLLDLISGTARLKMAVRGWVAELHLVEQLGEIGRASCSERVCQYV